jgi:hypothetical protein
MAEDVNDKIGQLVRKLAPGELEALLALIQKSTAEYVEKHLNSELEGTLKSFAQHVAAAELHQRGYTEAVAIAVNELAARTGDSREDVLLKALALYAAALDASEKGERLAVLGRDYKFIREIVGLVPNRQTANAENPLSIAR